MPTRFSFAFGMTPGLSAWSGWESRKEKAAMPVYRVNARVRHDGFFHISLSAKAGLTQEDHISTEFTINLAIFVLNIRDNIHCHYNP